MERISPGLSHLGDMEHFESYPEEMHPIMNLDERGKLKSPQCGPAPKAEGVASTKHTQTPASKSRTNLGASLARSTGSETSRR